MYVYERAGGGGRGSLGDPFASLSPVSDELYLTLSKALQ
jgi:hypothetical protein